MAQRYTKVCFAFYGAEPKWNEQYMAWLVTQQERCPKTSRLHWQTAVVFNKQVSMLQIQKMFPGLHSKAVQVINGTYQQNKNYCNNPNKPGVIEGTQREYGEMPLDPKPGKRTDLATAAANFLELGWDGVDDSTIVRYHRGLQFLSLVRKKPKNEVRQVYWFYGPTGLGKSREARQICDDLGLQYYASTCKGGWFDGYSGEPAIIIDEFNGGIETSELLAFTDR